MQEINFDTMKRNLIKKSLFVGFMMSALLVSACGDASTTTPSADGTEQSAPVIQNIKQTEAMPMLQDSNIVVIDVRTPGEVLSGYIDGADLFIDYNGDFKGGIANLDKSKTYLVYCRSGGRSSGAAKLMEEAGFTSICNLSGGISSWSGPVAK